MEENIKRRFVVDASFILSFLLKENLVITEQLGKLINEKVELISTPFLPYEVGNGLKSAVIRKRTTNKLAKQIYQEFFTLQISQIQPDLNQILNLALSKNISFYDASYLYLAKQLNAKLLTFDSVLQKKI